jgi:hypothetical protein
MGPDLHHADFCAACKDSAGDDDLDLILTLPARIEET